MMKLLLLVFAAIFKLCCTTLTFLNPKSLVEIFPEPIDVFYGNIGSIPYGLSLTGKIYWARNNGCGFLFMGEISKKSQLDAESIILVESGGCSIVKKAINAQMQE